MAFDIATNVSLNAGDSIKDREVQEFSYQFSRAFNTKGQAVSIPIGGQLKVTVKRHDSGTVELLNWMLDGLPKNGSISILKPDGGKMKTIEFTDGFCIDYTEEWKEGNTVHTEKIIISCREIKVEQAAFEVDWS
jgi:hypothetical protein